MKMKSVLVAALIVAIVCGVAALMTSKHQPVPAVEATKPPPPAAPVAVTPVPVTQAPTEPLPPEVTSVTNGVSRPAVKATHAPDSQAQQSPPVQPAPGGKEPVADPTARVALSLVGIDPDAEDYWVDAINDPSLSADERQNLIEDLNEDGLSDPKLPGPDDLPMILNRLRMIEELAPNAMDQVNWDAFKEAYKDLVNLADLASGTGGEAVN